MRKKRNRLITLLGVLLITLGIIFASMPFITNLVVKNQSLKVVNELEDLEANDLRANNADDGTFNYDAINNISATKTLINRPNYNREQIIGQLVIPDLNINLTLFNSLTDGNLLAGVTTMKPGQVMGERNYTIAGHYTNSKDVLLNNLLDAKMGQTIRLTNKETIYEYEVIDLIKVKATELHMINDSRADHYGQHIISIMSCYYYDTDYRWFVVGALTDTYPYTHERMVAK